MVMPTVTLEKLRLALIDLDEKRTLEITHQLLADGRATPTAILNTCQMALRVVGERYERREYYISGLIMAGELFKEVLELVQPPLEAQTGAGSAGTVVLGTVAGDIHDIGKNMFATSLRSFDFRVIDLGIDVAPEKFLPAVLEHKPDVVGLSGLIMIAFESMKSTTALIRAHDDELGYRPPVILGGSIIDGRVCQYAGADSWSTDAMEGVRLCQDLVARVREAS